MGEMQGKTTSTSVVFLKKRKKKKKKLFDIVKGKGNGAGNNEEEKTIIHFLFSCWKRKGMIIVVALSCGFRFKAKRTSQEVEK